jgi:CheY-like chemotaxis protein
VQDVLAATHCLHKGLPPGVFDPVEVLALYLGALGHDAGHFRLNNAFLKNSKHALYKKYRESVLENFHLGLVFELLEDEHCGIVEFLEEADKGRFRELVTTLILATDMAKHMGLFKQLQAFLADARARHRELNWMHDSARSDESEVRDGSEAGDGDGDAASDAGSVARSSREATPRSSANLAATRTARISDRDGAHESWVRPSIDGADPTQRVLVMQLLLKCADLGNVVRPLEIADAWGKRIMEEFYQQGEKELTLGLPLTTFPNRKNFDYIFARHQNGFLANVVRPLFDVFTSLCDFDTRESVIAAAAENGEAWTRRENAHRPREKGRAGAEAESKPVQGVSAVGNESTQTGNLARKPGALARQSTMGWVQEFKQSNLTMLTANAMEMKGLHLTLDFEYGADDECASAVRSLVPYVSRGELARLGRLGMLEADPEDAEDAGTSASFAEKLAATQTFDAAVVVATFDGFLDLERRVAAGAEAEARASKKEAREKQAERFAEAAAAFGAALSGVLAKAVDSVHASGGDVVRMGHDGIVCVFPLSGGGDERTRETRLGGRDKRDFQNGLSGKISEKSAAALRAARCAFTLVSQLSSAAPELSPVGAPDGGASRAHLWPGLRAFSRGTRVMVVESLQLSRMGMGRLLDHFGCMTHFAENASQAAAACANMEFDVILMNVLLPVKDGYELSRHIRAHGGPVNGRAYIAAVTYVQQPELLDQCVAAGMNEVIVKPATMSSLRLMFRRAKRRAREMKMQDAMRQHSFSSTESGGKASFRQSSENGRGTGTRGAGRRDKELVANPYSLSGPRSKKPAKRKPNGGGGNAARLRLGGPDDDARASLDDGGGGANLADVRLSLGSGQLPSLVESDLTRSANEKCVPVHLPRYSDMLISSSGGPDAARRRRASGLRGRSVDDGAVGASTAPGGAGKQTGALARFWRALCGYDVGSDGGPDARAVERAALHERSTSFASGARLSLGARAGRLSSDDGSGTADSGGAKGFDKVGVSLVRYKSSRNVSGTGSAPDRDPDPTEDPEDGSDDEADLYDADDETLDETSPLPVTIAVSAAVGFGRVATMRVGTSCGAALEGVRRNADASAPWDTLEGGGGGSGGALPELAEPAGGGGGGGAGGSGSAGSTPERRFPAARDAETKKPQGETRAAKPGCPVTRRVMLSADRDVVVAADAPVPGAPPRDACEAATAAAAGGSGEGGPFQQAATLIRVATAGDVALSPAAWRLVRENCEGDTPPVLRGGARLNRIRVHEVVPPLTNHPLAPRELAATVPSSPDPRRALAALAALVPRPVRAALAARAAASAAALARRRDRRDAGFDESDESAEEEEESGSESPSDKALRRLPMPQVAPRAAEAVSAVVYLPGPSRGAGRVWGDANELAQTVASAAAACVGLLHRFPHASLTRVGSDALFGRDVDKRTGGGGGGGDGIVLHCDFSPPLPKPAEGGVASSEPQASNAPETSLSERRAAAAAAATAFALAARAAMTHLGHAGASVGVASGRSVSMAAGAAERRCEWTVTGDVVSRAERLAAFADAEVLCDLLVVKQCASSGIIDFDPVPHAAGNDVVCARNLSAGNLDRIVRAAGGSRGIRGAGSSDAPFFAEGGVNFSGDFASSSLLGRTELTERGSVAGDGVAPGPCVFMPQGTRENFGDASAKQRAAREKRLESEKEAKRPEDGNAPADKEEDAAARSAAEAEAKEATGRLSYGALAALSLASASQATTQTLRALWDPGRLPAPPPLVAHETTLLAAKRVIAEAQEAMAPRLLFLSGPARAGKTRAAAAVLDLPEARRMWLLRTRGTHAVDDAVREDPRAGGGASIMSGGSFALASFQRLFHQLLGFSPEATSRERKAAVVALLEGCGEERERLGRYAKPILEILGIEKADGGAEDAEEDALGSDRWSERSGGTLRSGGSGGKSGARGGASPDASSSQNARAKTHDALASPRAKAKGSLRGERSTRGGGGGGGGGGLSLDSESSPGADEKSAEAEGGVERGASGGVGARRKPSRQASRLGLARDRSEASTIGGGEKGESLGRERLGLGGFLDAVSATAMKDATRHLCPSAMDALLGDGIGVNHPGCEGPSRRDSVTGGEDHHSERHEHHEHSDASSEAKMARAVIMGRLSGAVAFTRQLNGVQRRDHNRRFRAVAQRRKNTLESILVSANGASRLCETMALMLERLLLGRATQAAPAQPSLPGWILLVEDAHWLDPFSMGLIRALLERCSIPLAIVMTHVSGRDGGGFDSGFADADRTDSNETRATRNAKTRNAKRETTRVRTIARTSPCTTWTSPRTPARCSGRRLARNRATRRARPAGFRAGMFRRVAPTYGAPASVCPRRASRRWTTSDGSAKTWTGCWRCTPPRW